MQAFGDAPAPTSEKKDFDKSQQIGRCTLENVVIAFIVISKKDQTMRRVYWTADSKVTTNIGAAATFSDTLSASIFLRSAPFDLVKVFDEMEEWTIVKHSLHFVKVKMHWHHAYDEKGEVVLKWYMTCDDNKCYDGNGNVVVRDVDNSKFIYYKGEKQ